MVDSLLFAVDSVRSSVDPNPLLPMTHWWQLMVALLAAATMLVTAILLGFRDRKDQPLGVSAGLLLFRLSLIGIAILAFCNFEKRQVQVSVEPSTVAVILDNSLSMNLESESDQLLTRFEFARTRFRELDQWSFFTSEQQLVFYQLHDSGRLTEFSRLELDAKPDVPKAIKNDQAYFGWWFIALAALLFVLSMFVSSGMASKSNHLRGLFVFVGALTIIFGAAWNCLSFVADDSPNFLSQFSSSPKDNISSVETLTDESRREFLNQLSGVSCDIPVSPLARSISWLIDRIESKSLAAILLLTDGIDSDPPGFQTVARKAQDRAIPVFPIGFGASRGSNNAAIKDLYTEKKVYVGNPFSISGAVVVEASQFPVTAKVTLSTSTQKDGATSGTDELKIKEFNIDASGAIPFEFDIANSPVGVNTYKVTVSQLDDELDLKDNESEISVEVVDQKAKVLLWAGGPNREFRFLRNQLFRDPNVQLDVFLQSAETGSYQESDRQLTEFPKNSAEFEAYDCVVAFDPDWTELNAEQTEMVRTWVADESGGLVLIAGPVNTPVWTALPPNDPIVSPVRKLYPVSFFGQVSGSIKLGRFGGSESFPLTFTRASKAFDFLRFDPDPDINNRIWNDVEIFGFYAVNEEKAGADVIAHFSDPLTSFGGKLPIYLASHLYGNGRVFFQASGELWRTRGVGPEFFEQYYSRLIRWTSQGRLLRDDNKMSLTLDKNKCTVGDYVTVRAVVNRESSEFDGLKEIDVSMVRPNSSAASPQEVKLIRIQSDGNRLAFENRIRISSSGRHVFKLIVPGSSQDFIEAELVASIPNRELFQTGRNDQGLEQLAKLTGGIYLLSKDFDRQTLASSVLPLISDHSIESVAPMADDKSFSRKTNFSFFVCFALFLVCNWVIRRLNRLA